MMSQKQISRRPGESRRRSESSEDSRSCKSSVLGRKKAGASETGAAAGTSEFRGKQGAGRSGRGGYRTNQKEP